MWDKAGQRISPSMNARRTTGQEAVAHFGLGKEDAVDVEVVLPHGKGKLTRKGVKANQMLTVKP